MNGKYSFNIRNEDRRRDLPRKIIVGQNDTETPAHVLLKFLGFILFHRERIQLETNLHMDSIPFTPDLVQLDYELRPKLWVECGDCSLTKLDKLAVKAPEAEIWIVKKSVQDAEQLKRFMEKDELRTGRYGIIGLDHEMLEEMTGLLKSRNDVVWVRGEFDPPHLQFDFNGLWFDATFQLIRY